MAAIGVLFCLFPAGMPGAARAQAVDAAPAPAGQCRIPPVLPRPRMAVPEREGGVRRVPVGGYTLALSWSPQHCAGGRREAQCDARVGRFGFILHGLWPDGHGRAWPQYCAPAAPLPAAVLRANFCATPSVDLMQHEWAKHGTCMAARPDVYFDRARALYQAIRMPDMRPLAQGATAGAVARAFVAANPRLRVEMIRVLAERGALSEVHVCLDTAFRPARCPAGKMGLPAGKPLRVRLPG